MLGGWSERGSTQGASVKCFYHREADAVGSCKACSKGLCGTCAADVGKGLACRDSCEEQVRNINQLVDRNIRVSPTSERVLGKYSRAYLATGVFQILAGGVFAFLGQSMDGAFRTGVTAIGALVALYGVWQIAYAWAVRNATGKVK
jgi:hypothetical protein